jgi:hypothetical protein
MLTGFLFLVMLICIAFLWNEGLWGNAITLINVVLAAMIATNYFEPLASLIEGLDDSMASFTYMWDFLSIWMIFVLTFGIMRAVTDKLSKTKVKFKGVVEYAGRSILAIVVGYVFMSFTCMTLHLAPLAERPFRGAFHNTTKAEGLTMGTVYGVDKTLPSHFLFLAPDRQWLAFVQSRSWAPNEDAGGSGALSRWWGKRTFDPKSEFVFKYGARRRMHEEHNRKHGFGRIPN